VYFSFIWFAYVAMFPPWPYTIYIFHSPTARYSLYMLKVPLNTKQANKLCQRNGCTCFNAHWLLSIKIYNHGTVKTAHGTVTPSLSTKKWYATISRKFSYIIHQL